MKKTTLMLCTALMGVTLTGCMGLFGVHKVPDNIQPVTNFDVNKYLGTWYEIARLDHSFESGLSQVTATYSQREDDGIRVVNKGYNAQKDQWQTAEGKAYFVDSPDKAHLKVSFFGPFYGGYIVFHLEDYQYALVTGPDKSYFWFLSRTPQVPAEIQQRLISKAKQLGFAVDELIMVDHS